MTDASTLFRIHMVDGRKIDVAALTPKDATAKVKGAIRKIKRVKDEPAAVKP